MKANMAIGIGHDDDQECVIVAMLVPDGAVALTAGQARFYASQLMIAAEQIDPQDDEGEAQPEWEEEAEPEGDKEAAAPQDDPLQPEAPELPAGSAAPPAVEYRDNGTIIWTDELKDWIWAQHRNGTTPTMIADSLGIPPKHINNRIFLLKKDRGEATAEGFIKTMDHIEALEEVFGDRLKAINGQFHLDGERRTKRELADLTNQSLRHHGKPLATFPKDWE